jgi:hypothetical protein
LSALSSCNGGGNQSGCSTDVLNWTGTDSITGPTNNSTIQFDFCDANITKAGCPSSSTQAYQSEEGIIGGPNSSNRYTSSGIKGSAKNPYIFEQVTLDITLSSGAFNVAQSNYTNLIFGMGSQSNDEDAINGAAPEPSSFWMMAAALGIGFATFRCRQLRARNSGSRRNAAGIRVHLRHSDGR